ncbi:MAG: sensor histidine kinase [Gaiellaceae bacterium]
MSQRATRIILALLAIAGVVLGVFAYWVQIDNLPQTTSLRSWAGVFAAWAFLVAGLIAWSRRPGNRLGPLMVAVCFALLARQLRYSHDELAFTVFFLLGELGYALYIHVALAYPSGRVTDRWERLFLKVSYTVALAFPLAILLFYDSSHRLRYFDPARRESLLLVSGDPGAVDALQKVFAVAAYGILAGVFLVLIARKLAGATQRARRILAPLLLAAVVAALWAVLNSILTFAVIPPGITYDLFWWQIVGLTALPLALLAGLLRARLARVHVGELVVHLEQTSPGELRDELALALDDPTLVVGLWLPDQREYVDAAGNPFLPPIDGPERAVTRIEHEGQPLAVLVHDPTLRDEPKLVEEVAAAARLALVNARLHAEVRAQLEMVQESRARIVTAADEERRRIERDLHDGAQQRLVALALELRSAQRRLGEERDPEMDQLLESTADELQVALQELRELAQGIHPGILTQGGLATALESLAARVPLTVTVAATQERLAPDVEATAYFVACEALTNVVKHSQATQAAIRAQREDGWFVIEIEDNGVGGASTRDGTGLRGLADRVEAHGGHFRIESSPGSGTRVLGEIPCAS